MKLVTAPIQFVAGADMSANITSPAIDVLQTDRLGLQVNYAGSPTGTLAIEGSIDGINYAALYFSVNGNTTVADSVSIPTSASPIVVDMDTGALVNIRVVYTASSGTGEMGIYFTKKRIGD